MSEAKQVVFLMATEKHGWVPLSGELIEIAGEPLVVHRWDYTDGPTWKVSCPRTGFLAAEEETREAAIQSITRRIAKHGIGILYSARKKAEATLIRLGPRPDFYDAIAKTEGRS